MEAVGKSAFTRGSFSLEGISQLVQMKEVEHARKLKSLNSSLMASLSTLPLLVTTSQNVYILKFSSSSSWSYFNHLSFTSTSLFP